MMEIFNLLPRNRNNLIAFCIHKANAYALEATQTDLRTHKLAAKFFAALTPFAAFTTGTKALSIGIWQMSITWIKPHWVSAHVNGWEEIKTGGKAYLFIPIAIGYAALSILLGKAFIKTIEIPFEFEYTHEANIANCRNACSDASPHHLVHHEGKLVIRPKTPFFSLDLVVETIEIARETFEIAKGKVQFNPGPVEIHALRCVIKTIIKTDSYSATQDWYKLRLEAKRLERMDDDALVAAIFDSKNISFNPIEKAFNQIHAGESYIPQAFSTTQAMAFLQKYYSKKTIETVFSFYTQPGEHIISTRLFHAIIIGIQANLTCEDVIPLTVERLEQMRAKLPTEPNRYYTDYHYVQLEKDLFFSESLRSVERYKPNSDNADPNNYRHHGFSEFLAKHIVYPVYGTGSNNWRIDITDTRQTNFVNGTLFPCYRNGVQMLMQINFGIARDGLNMIEVQDVNNEFGATLFRGTGDWPSLKRDLEYLFGGVGFASFEDNCKELLDRFHTSKTRPKVWYVIGHSLGGSDSMRFTAAMVKSAKDQMKEIPQQLHLWTFNSPKVETELADSFIRDVEEIDKRQSLKSKDQRVQIVIHHTRVFGDIIQWPGGALLGYEGDTHAPDTLSYNKDIFALEDEKPSRRHLHSATLFDSASKRKAIPSSS